MCYCTGNGKAEIQGEIINSFFDEILNELANVRLEINSVSLTAGNLNTILFRLGIPTRKIYSFCRGISLLDPRLEPIAQEMLFLSSVLDEIGKQLTARGSYEPEVPIIDLCQRSLEICAAAVGLCSINPLFCPLARSVCLLAKMVCVIIPPLQPAASA